MKQAVYFSYGGKYVQEKKYMPTAGSFDQAWENMLNDTLNDDEADQSEYEEDENDDFSGFDKEAF